MTEQTNNIRGDYSDVLEAIRTLALIKKDSGIQIIEREEGASAQWLFDFRGLLMQPHWLNRYADIFWERYEKNYPFQVCGMESAAISLVAAIVMKGVERGTPVNGCFIRKSRKRDGLMKVIEGTLTDDPIILVDDLINSGKTFHKQIKILEEAHKHVSDIFALLAFRNLSAYQFAMERKINVSTLFSLLDLGIPLLNKDALEVPRNSFNTLWKFQGTHPSYHWVVQKSAPAIDTDRVYFGTDAGTFYALNQSDGSVAWTFAIGKHPEGKGIFSSPSLARDTVFFGAYDGNVYALDAKTGNKRWAYEDADWVGSSPALAPDMNLLFIGLEFGLFGKRGGIVALSLDTGKKVWEQRTREHTHAPPLYIKEKSMVVVGSNDGILRAFDAKSGAQRWEYRTSGHIKTRAAYDAKRDTVLVGSMDGNLYIVLASDGTPLYAHRMGAGIYSTPLVYNNLAYVTSLDKSVYTIDLTELSVRWEFATSGRIFASPVLADESLWIGSNDGRLYELNPISGTLKNFFQASERIVNCIAYNEVTKKIFLSTHTNDIYCIEKNDKK